MPTIACFHQMPSLSWTVLVASPNMLNKELWNVSKMQKYCWRVRHTFAMSSCKPSNGCRNDMFDQLTPKMLCRWLIEMCVTSVKNWSTTHKYGSRSRMVSPSEKRVWNFYWPGAMGRSNTGAYLIDWSQIWYSSLWPCGTAGTETRGHLLPESYLRAWRMLEDTLTSHATRFWHDPRIIISSHPSNKSFNEVHVSSWLGSSIAANGMVLCNFLVT